MILIAANLLDSRQLSQPITIVHGHNKENNRCCCSVHEQQYLEAFLGEKLTFQDFTTHKAVKYCKTNETQDERIKTLPTTLTLGYIKSDRETGQIFFSKNPITETANIISVKPIKKRGRPKKINKD